MPGTRVAPRRVARPRVIAASTAASVLALALMVTGCSPTTPHPTASTSGPTHSATPHPTPSATPRLVPDGTAKDNLPLFRAVVEHVWAGADKVKGRAYVDALVKAGFDKKAMQVTADLSTVGNPAESLQFSVRWKDGQCLVGQVGPDTGTPVTAVLPGLAGGGCLLGRTRVIDW
ncbi:DUF6993 domain-containing protein [Microbacterium luticocti]|uniref:DUF6993 domain-containing protein n=1 Tax=Microbacterium luticocti TaxID=451764 RepID=UPI001FE20BEA|nr:hypothetical protein [Microbacterium luticocti]